MNDSIKTPIINDQAARQPRRKPMKLRVSCKANIMIGSKEEMKMTEIPKQIRVNECIDALLFDGENAADALGRAHAHDGAGWRIASLPDVLKLFVDSFDNDELGFKYATTSSEEHVLRNDEGEPIALVLHGGGILTPERMKYGFVDNSADQLVKPTEEESRMLLEGCLPDGTQFPVIDYNDLRRFVGKMPERYAVTVKLIQNQFRKKCGLEEEDLRGDNLRYDPLFVARCGSRELALATLFKAKERWGNCSGSYARNMQPRPIERDSSCLLSMNIDTHIHIMRYGLDLMHDFLKLPDKGYADFEISAGKRRQA